MRQFISANIVWFEQFMSLWSGLSPFRPFLPVVAVLLWFNSACQNPKVDSLNYLQSVKNGQLTFADGSTEAIPHWGDTTWTIVFCVRHAEKAKDDPKDPQLTPEGEARAERLGRILAGATLDSVYASPYKRTQLTAEPVQRRGNTAPVVTYKPDKQDLWFPELLESSKGKKMLVVGHQNTIPQLLNLLTGKMDYDNIPDQDFGRMYLVATQGVGITVVKELRY
ncbi:MAG: histidine phosphatase family protein [Saprospiraceae bacterium]|nr:histidine phosphatase family protein [Saprospiraceae bacterium]